MIESRISIKQQFKSNDETILQYGLIFNQNNFINTEEIQNNINDILTSYEKLPSIDEVVLIIKNTLKDIEPNHMWVSFSKEKDYYEKINYIKNTLNSYSFEKENPIYEIEKIKIDYDLEKGLNFNVVKKEKEKNNIDLNIIHQIFNEKVEKIKKLQEVKAITLSYYDKLICKIYNMFYQEKPNFNRNEDRLKAHSMLAFLEEFGINTPSSYDEDYSFYLNSKNIVVSLSLIKRLNKMALLGEIKESFEELHFKPEAKQIIEIVGEKIREAMQDKENPTEWLINLIRIDYIKNNYLASNSSIKEIAKESQNTEETVNSSLVLIKSINNRISKNY